jgi:hypothetical protein
MSIQRFQQRPPVVDAMMFDGTNQDEILAWCSKATYDSSSNKLYLYNTIEVKPNEWVVTGVCANWSKYTECFLDCYDPIEGGGGSFK